MKHAELLYKKYSEEMSHFENLPFMSLEAFDKDLERKLECIQCVEYEEDGKLKGVLFYTCWQNPEMVRCYIPEFGYYAEDDKVLVKLFQKLCETIVDLRPCEFTVRLYAHDYENLRSFNFMEFGTVRAKSVKKIIGEKTKNDYDLKVIDKETIKKNWDELWQITRFLSRHNAETPIYTSEKDYSEIYYKEFFADEGVEVIGAYKDKKLIGFVDWNIDEVSDKNCRAAYVGDVYVSPSYRGKGLSKVLLDFVEERAKKRNAKVLWVEYPTANPSGRRFFEKYFEPYQYDMMRKVKRD